MEQQAAGNICSVRVTDGDKIVAVEAVLRSCAVQELLHFMGAEDQILFIEDAFGQPPEITRHAVLQHISPDAQHRGAGRQRLRQRKQVMLIAAGAME
ncbi:hypothetical protein D3C73_1518460 [compost metagenome]